ncbi:hypothetical protein CMV_023912 [Castanea mollissima]|uniref:Derlin n=1 Tax=Castanea mollissima TaxID=60419 RepID=A0A8J4QSC1_9ROSI|nr:hypothetical protein CMV_023912 [Castanea mollissima]
MRYRNRAKEQTRSSWIMDRKCGWWIGAMDGGSAHGQVRMAARSADGETDTHGAADAHGARAEQKKEDTNTELVDSWSRKSFNLRPPFPPPSHYLDRRKPFCAMSTPAEYYRSLPPVSKFYGVACLMTTSAYYLQLYNPYSIALFYGLVLKRFQVWRLITNFFFLGPFSFPFAFHLLMIARYGVSLERGPFDKRTADYVWMFVFGALSLLVMAAVPYLWSPFMGGSLVFMLVYVWSREFLNARISIYGLVSLKGFYLPYAMLAVDLLLGNPLKPSILGMVVGHLYYFLTVLHPLAGGKFILKTPLWVHKLVAFWGMGTQMNTPVQRDPSAGVAFRGRSYQATGLMAVRGLLISILGSTNTKW